MKESPVILFALMIATLATPMLCASDEFPETMEREGLSFRLSGTGTYVYRIFFRVYDAAFYSTDEVSAGQIPGDVPMRLEIRYLRDVEKDVFIKSANHFLKKNLSRSQLSAIAQRLEILNAHYADVEEGDRYTLVYVPGKGTTLEFNDVSQVTIAGADFAAAYFTIWLGEHPLDKGLRRELLSGLADSS